MNRFTHDIGAIDEHLILAFFETIDISIHSIFVFLLVVVLNPIMIVPTIVIISLFYLVRQHYIPTSRALKRIDAISKPICTFTL